MKSIKVTQEVSFETLYESAKEDRYTLSIIMPCHNSGSYIGTMLFSLASQKFDGGVEIIFVLDDCSDDTLDRIKSDFIDKVGDRYAITVLSMNSKGFVSVAREVGRSVKRGDYEWHIDSDDYLIRPDAIYEICNILRVHEPPLLHLRYHSDIDGWLEDNYGSPGSFDTTLWSNVYKTALSDKQSFGIAFVGEDSDFFGEFVKSNEIDTSDVLCTLDYYYYYTQLRSSSVSALWWLQGAKRRGLTSRLADYYAYLEGKEWLKSYGGK